VKSFNLGTCLNRSSLMT